LSKVNRFSKFLQQTSQQCLSAINMALRDENKILKKNKYTQNTVTHVGELKSIHLKCNLFAFSSTCAEYLQKFSNFQFPKVVQQHA